MSRASSPVYSRVEHIFTCKISARIKFDTDSNAFAWCCFFFSLFSATTASVWCLDNWNVWLVTWEFDDSFLLSNLRRKKSCDSGAVQMGCAPEIITSFAVEYYRRTYLNCCHRHCARFFLFTIFHSKRERHLSALTLASRGGVMAVELGYIIMASPIYHFTARQISLNFPLSILTKQRLSGK